MLLATLIQSLSRNGTVLVCILPSFRIAWPGVPGKENKAFRAWNAGGTVLVASDGLGTPEHRGEWLRGVKRTLFREAHLALPSLLKQPVPGKHKPVGGIDSAPRYQAANSFLSSRYFYEEPSPSSTLAKSVSAREGFKLQPNLAPSSHTVFFPEACECLAGTNLGDLRAGTPAGWPPWVQEKGQYQELGDKCKQAAGAGGWSEL